ncbi:MAG: murein biosynthesis integral membrane protein MurJ [Chloroflexi bacterium]|nr:murein biosynthesis integral membrane protein MurJ [Chloroflexota bacterium]
MTTGRSIARAGLIVTGAFLVSRALGWIRIVVIGTTFGASRELDAFFAAFRIPDLIFQLVAAGALGSALIPVLAGLFATGEPSRAWRVANTVTNLVTAALVLLAAIMAVFAPWIVPAITPGFDAPTTALAVELTRVMLLSPILLGLGAVATSILNAGDRFAAAAIAPVVYNLAIIGAALLLAPAMGVHALAIGVVAGSALHIAIQLPALRTIGYRYASSVDIRDPATREALLLLVPRAIGLGVSQITLLVSTALASGLAVGAVTAFNVAFTLLQIPIGVIGVPLAMVILPSMSRELVRGEVEEYLRLVTRAVRLLLFVMLPVTAIGIVVRLPAIAVLFDYGRFGDAAVALTADALLFFLLGLAAHALIAVLARAFYAGKDTVTPVIAAVIAVAINVGMGLALVGPMGLGALSLAIAVGAWAECVFLLVVLRRRYPDLGLTAIGRAFIDAGAAAAIGGAGALAAFLALEGVTAGLPEKAAQLVLLAVPSAVGLGAYLLLSVALRIPELPTIVGVMADLLRAGRGTPGAPRTSGSR